MKRKIIYLVNPVSGTGKKEMLEKLIRKKTTEKSIDFVIEQSNIYGDYDYLKDKIEREEITDVVIAGGDGTVNRVISGLQDTNINFGIIPVGSGNGLAFCAGIPKNPVKALDIIFSGSYGF